MQAITIENDRAQISDQCRGCGRCGDGCPENAIQVTFDNDSFYRQMVNRLTDLVDVK